MISIDLFVNCCLVLCYTFCNRLRVFKIVKVIKLTDLDDFNFPINLLISTKLNFIIYVIILCTRRIPLKATNPFLANYIVQNASYSHSIHSWPIWFIVIVISVQYNYQLKRKNFKLLFRRLRIALYFGHQIIGHTFRFFINDRYYVQFSFLQRVFFHVLVTII